MGRRCTEMSRALTNQEDAGERKLMGMLTLIAPRRNGDYVSLVGFGFCGIVNLPTVGIWRSKRFGIPRDLVRMPALHSS